MTSMKLYVSLVIALIIAYASTSLGAHDLSQDYRFYATLDQDGMYQLFWNFDLDAETISFAVQVKTTGWVGFGLSPNGQMPGSDVVIGWVDGEGMEFFHDRYAEGRFLPPIDSSQDWFLVRGEEEEGTTVLEFTRNLTTCDDKDLNIEHDTSRVVWSWHSSDPTDEDSIPQHEFQGTTSINLLGGLNEDFTDPPSSDSFTINYNNFTIPNDTDTTYWCSAFRLPEKIREQERFIYKASPVIPEGSTLYTHHMLIYLCMSVTDVDVGAGSVCESASVNVNSCRRESLLGAWAVGGTDFIYPEGVAFPIGGPGNPSYVVLEIHYDNPNLDSGVIDSSGMEFFYSDTKPVHRAGIMILGHVVSPTMIIPPKVNDFVVEGLCASDCTQEFFPPEGITVFANILHTHLAGHGAVLQHFRKNEECDVIEELPPIEANLKYDFNYQQFNLLPSEVKVLQGDILKVKCLYQTTEEEESRITVGGASTRDEMCLSFIQYYPQTNMYSCLSTPLTSSFIPFSTKHVKPSTQQALYGALDDGNVTMIRESLQEVEWTSQAAQDLEATILSNSLYGICSSITGENVAVSTSHPDVQCQYEAPDKCSGTEPAPCCERLATGNGAYPTTSISAFILVAVTMMSIVLKF